MFDAEINGALNLLELANKYKTKRFIYSSSAACYGEPKKLPISEKLPCQPESPYGISKYTFE